MQQKTMSTRAWVEMTLLALIWGASFLSNKVALTEVGFLTTVAFRLIGACAILWVYVAWRGLPIPRDPRVWFAFFVMGLLNNALPFSLITWGQLTIPTGLAGILNAATAILGVMVAALVFRDERLTLRKSVGVAVGFFGVATAIGLSALTDLDLASLSQLALLAATLSYAVSGAFARVTLTGLPPQIAAAGMLTGSSLVMIPLSLAVEGVPTLHHDAQIWAALAYLAIMSTAVAYLLLYRLIGMVGAGNTSLTTLLVAPIAIVLGALVFDEVLPVRAYGGFALIALGLVILDGRLFQRHRSRTSIAESAP